ncbi:MAG TPA: hypothetical protein VIW29_04635 [Polyangiaceae bacterium]
MATTTKTLLGCGAALLGALASGCSSSGGQTGEEQAPCWGEITPLALDAESPLGFSAQDSLSLAVGKHTATLHWIPTMSYRYGPESGDGELQVRVTSLGRAYFATQGDGQAIQSLLCPPSVLADVTLELDSAGGALHESFRGVLAASNAESATLSATLLGGQLGGSFAFEPASLGVGKYLAQMTLNSSFSAGSFGGAISAGIEQAHSDGANSAVSLENVPLAWWGSAGVPGQARYAE